MLYLVRHGETAFNKTNRLRGRSDVPLSALGVKQVKAAASLLLNKKVQARKIVSSSLVRAKQTAAILGKVLRLPVEIDSGIDTWDVGNLTGRSSSSAATAGELLKFVKSPSLKVPGGESFGAFMKRYSKVLHRHLEGPDAILVSSHTNISSTKDALRGTIPKYRESKGLPKTPSDIFVVVS